MPEKNFDVIVVGSGASGGYAAKELTERGLEVLVLEAGSYLKENLFHGNPGMKGVGVMDRAIGTLQGQHIQSRITFYSSDTKHLFVNDRQNPYTYPPDKFYLWARGRNVGGRFLSYGRVLMRMSDYDFKAASRDGIGEDWPICYDDLAPYYEKVETFIGVFGTKEGLPNLPDGKYFTEAGYSRAERQFKEAVESTWPERHVIPWRYARKEATPTDSSRQNRSSSPLMAAEATGRLTLRYNSIASRINIDPASGKATGVAYIDAITKKTCTASANVVMLCSSTIETIRLMLLSACSRHPNGLGNSSGLLGRYFMDQEPCMVFGSIPNITGYELVDGTNVEDNHGGIYIPRFQNLDRVTHPQFKRGFNIQSMCGRGFVPDGVPSLYAFMGQGEMPPYYENSVTLDPRKKDAWGIPAPHINISMTENERTLMRFELDTIKEMVARVGWNIDFAGCALGLDDPDKILPHANPIERFLFRTGFKKSLGLGASIHECGGARMGNDPAKSVLNAHNQCWDAPNVFVTDPACFASNGTCGPVLTIMALSMRAADFIANEYGKNQELSCSAAREI
jgi:choline dehydrogenase-like flavoprotein